MANTQRTIADLFTLLADNTAGDISAQDVRDVVQTFRPDHGDLYLTSSSVTSIANVNGWTKVAGTTAITPGTSMNIDDGGGVSNRLRYKGTVARIMHIAGSISVSAAASNVVLEFAVVKNADVSTTTDTNDTIDDIPSRASIIRNRASSTDVSAFALHAFIPMVPDDYIEIWARNTTNATDLTIETMNFFAMGMPNA